MYGNFLLIYLNWREICPLRMPKDLLCFLPNRGFVLKDTVCWPLPQDSKSRIGLSWGLYLDDKWYIVDLCHWPAIWFLGVCRVYSNGIPDPGKQTSQPLSRQHWSFCTLSVRSWILVSIMSIFTLVFSLNAGSLWWRSSRSSLASWNSSSCLFVRRWISLKMQDGVQKGMSVGHLGLPVSD